MNAPTLGDMLRLLTSDESTAAWLNEARDLAQHSLDEEPADDIAWRIDILTGELSNGLTSIEEDRGREEILSDDLGRLSEMSKRGAVMLLHAAWAAEQAATPKPREKRPDLQERIPYAEGPDTPYNPNAPEPKILGALRRGQ